jgi:hypothetical protein
VALPAARGDLAYSHCVLPEYARRVVLLQAAICNVPVLLNDGLCSSNEPYSRMEQPCGRWTFCNKTCR